MNIIGTFLHLFVLNDPKMNTKGNQKVSVPILLFFMYPLYAGKQNL
jgi:hypothetical protein